MAQALAASGTDTVWEFAPVWRLRAAARRVGRARRDGPRYAIVDLSAGPARAAAGVVGAIGARVEWLDRAARRDAAASWSATRSRRTGAAAVLGRYTLAERGVVVQADGRLAGTTGRPTLAPPLAVGTPQAHFTPGYLTEVHLQQQASSRRWPSGCTGGAAFFVDYGFPEAEYYHPQRRGGTPMLPRAPCRRRSARRPRRQGHHRPRQLHRRRCCRRAGAGWTCSATPAGPLPDQLRAGADAAGRQPGDGTHARWLIDEHEMGELFSAVIGLARGSSTRSGSRRGPEPHLDRRAHRSSAQPRRRAPPTGPGPATPQSSINTRTRSAGSARPPLPGRVDQVAGPAAVGLALPGRRPGWRCSARISMNR